MSFLGLVRREMEGSLPRLALMSALGGLSNAAILASVNAGAQPAEAGQPDFWSAALFVISLILYIKTQNYILITATAEIEAVVHRIRIRILDEVRQSELATIETIGRSDIIVAVTEDAATLTQASTVVAFGVQGLVLVVFVAIYVAYLSLIAFLLSTIIIGAAAALYHIKARERAEGMREAASWERQLVNRISDLLEGFKEVRLNSARSNDLIDTIREGIATAANVKIFTQSESSETVGLLHTALYLLLGAIAFVVPTFSGSVDTGSTAKNTMAVCLSWERASVSYKWRQCWQRRMLLPTISRDWKRSSRQPSGARHQKSPYRRLHSNPLKCARCTSVIPTSPASLGSRSAPSISPCAPANSCL